MKTKTTAAAIAIGLAALALTSLSSAQTADDIFRRAQERFSQEEKNQASWPAEAREAADRTSANLKATRCSDEDSEAACQIVIFCSTAPEITGETLPDDKELMAARKALDDVEDDLKKMASAMDKMKIANARFERGARAARDKCEAKVRRAYRSVSNLADKIRSGPSRRDKPARRYLRWSGGDPPDGDGEPQLMRKTPPATSIGSTGALRTLEHVAFGRNHTRHCERSEAIQRTSGLAFHGLLGWTAPERHLCAMMRFVETSSERSRPWTRLSALAWIRRSVSFSCMASMGKVGPCCAGS